jgi:predicted Zn-dependent protease with MMP-like domain
VKLHFINEKNWRGLYLTWAFLLNNRPKSDLLSDLGLEHSLSVSGLCPIMKIYEKEQWMSQPDMMFAYNIVKYWNNKTLLLLSIYEVTLCSVLYVLISWIPKLFFIDFMDELGIFIA